jgi:hypothetical protein
MDKNKNTEAVLGVNFLAEMSKFTFASKYARYNPAAERRETWLECVGRTEAMHLNKFKKVLSKEDLKRVERAFDAVREKHVVPSMRSLQYAGPAIQANELRLYNCSMRHLDSIRTFAEIMFLSMSGCGIGIGLYKKYINRLPDLVNAEDKTGTIITYVVEDSCEGWSDSFEALLNCYMKNTAYTGRKIVFDYSRVRKAGTPLKTSGGKAPGHKGLKNAHVKIKERLDYIIEELNLKRMRSIDIYDILMHCVDATLSGGSRRSATIVLFDKDDTDMLQAKTNFTVSKHTRFVLDKDIQRWCGRVTINKKKYEVELTDYEYNEMLLKHNQISWIHIEPQRARSNNTIRLIREETTQAEVDALVEHTKMYGEPGFFFANKGAEDALVNPCLPGSATLITQTGVTTMKDIQVGDKIWSAEGWTTVIQKWNNGIKPVFKYNTTAGTVVATENHKFVSKGEKVEIKDCDSLDLLTNTVTAPVVWDPQDVMDGLVFGDGCRNAKQPYLIIGKNDQDYFNSEITHLIKNGKNLNYTVATTVTNEELPHTYDRVIPDRFICASLSKIAGFLRGLFSANGSAHSKRISFKTSSNKLKEQVILMLSCLGIKCYSTTNKPIWVTFSNGRYLCKQSYDINIYDRKGFSARIGFLQRYKNEILTEAIAFAETSKKAIRNKTTYDIFETTALGEQEVFDIAVDNQSHTYWSDGFNVSNCAEIVTIPVTKDGVCGVQNCNLTEINGKALTNQEDLIKAAENAAIIGTLQAAYTKFKYLGNASREITEEEALLGISITGLLDNPKICLNEEYLTTAAQWACATNELWAKKLGINPAARLTCVKPSGTVGIVLQTSSGIHPHHANKYFRRIQCNKHDPVFQYFKKHNPHMVEESVWSANKTDEVVTFPIYVNGETIVKKDLTALQHMEIIKKVYNAWVKPGTSKYNKKPITHNISCTVLVKDEEWADVSKYMYANRDAFTAISFLPALGDKLYKQAPLESIVTEEDEAKYQALIAGYKPVDYKKLKELEDTTTAMDTIACSGGACTI